VTPCPGVCNAAWRATGEGEPREGDPWCYHDTARIRRYLPALDDLAAILEAHADGYATQGTSPARYGHDTRSPSPVADILLDLDDFLTGWEDAYRDDHNRRHPERPWLTRPYRGDLTTVRHGTVCWLVTNLTGLLSAEFPGAADFGLEVAQRHRELATKAAVANRHARGIVPCPNCELMLLGWVDGYDGLICGACGRYVTREEYDDDCKTARRRLETAS
jgi:hypothetical protein